MASTEARDGCPLTRPPNLCICLPERSFCARAAQGTVPITTPREAAAPEAAAPAAAAGAPAAAPAAVPGGTATVPVQFAVPQGKVACVAPGKLMRIEGAVNVDPPSVGFGEVAPDDWQGNAAALRLTNAGQAQQTITHISCAPLQNMSPSTIPFFAVQFGDGANAPRVKCEPLWPCAARAHAGGALCTLSSTGGARSACRAAVAPADA